MKNKILLISLLFFISGALFAQSLSGIKICIDPGHGGHDASNDRFVPETGYWESEGNWEKANYLKPMLEALGATVILTRDGNDDSDDISLSARDAIANQNNVDYFHSIHSNAANQKANYTLLLYKEVNGQPEQPEAKRMCQIMVDELFKVNRVTAKYVRGDMSFLHFNLGVLRQLNMPGTLSEGSFHDYIPESFRLQNSGYRKQEAYAIMKAFLKFYSKPSYEKGIVSGILRDKIAKTDLSYNPNASLGDDCKPLNFIKVTLKPGDRVYTGKEDNNGFFFFDDVEPGNYTVVYTAENFSKDSVDITVAANQIVTIDKFLFDNPNPNAPKVVGYSPENASEGLSNLTEIVVEFDISMEQSATEAALKINPSVNGKFRWENNQKRMIFTPSPYYVGGTVYTVEVNNDAKTVFGKYLETPTTFKFTTRSEIKILTQYPKNLANGVSNRLDVILQLDAPIKPTTLASNVSFVDSEGKTISPKVDFAGYAKGIIKFYPSSPLKYGADYTVTFKAGVGDIEGLIIDEDIIINFTTMDSVETDTQIADAFDSKTPWSNPATDPGSNGIDPTRCRISTSSATKVEGSYAVQLIYSFNQEDAYCKISRDPMVGLAGDSKFGVWVKGELSGNVLEYCFTTDAGENVAVEVDTLNWTGWLYKEIDVKSVKNGEAVKFAGIGIKRVAGADSTGFVYFDKAASTIVTTGVEDSESALPTAYSLEQNYPNPFNPTTKIKFSVPEMASVRLEIYNILGEKVRTLLNGESFNAGNFNVTWDARNDYGQMVPTGIYLYKIQAGKFSSVKKMMLLK